MVSNDDRCANTKLYVGNLSSRTSSNDLDRLFSNFGRVRDVNMKRDYAFVELGDRRDADAARYGLDDTVFDGSRITVKFAKGVTRGPPGYGQCFKSTMFGHWAGDCKAADRMILALALALAFQFLFVSFFFLC